MLLSSPPRTTHSGCGSGRPPWRSLSRTATRCRPRPRPQACRPTLLPPPRCSAHGCLLLCTVMLWGILWTLVSIAKPCVTQSRSSLRTSEYVVSLQRIARRAFACHSLTNCEHWFLQITAELCHMCGAGQGPHTDSQPFAQDRELEPVADLPSAGLQGVGPATRSSSSDEGAGPAHVNEMSPALSLAALPDEDGPGSLGDDESSSIAGNEASSGQGGNGKSAADFAFNTQAN